MTINEAIDIIPILKGASSTVKSTVLAHGRMVSIKEGDILFREKEDANSIYFVANGFVVLYRHDHLGNRKNIFIYGKGEILNEEILDKPVETVSGQAMTDCSLLAMRRNEVISMMDDPSFAKSIICSETGKIRRLYRQLANTTSRKQLEVQVASKLWRLACDYGEEVPEGVRVPFGLTVTFLADMVGAKRESTSRVVSSLKEAGLVKVMKGYFIITDMQGIRDVIHKKK